MQPVVSCGLLRVDSSLCCGRPLLDFSVNAILSISYNLFVFTPFPLLINAFISVIEATVLHASFRTPNLKARLNTFREEFRAVWRNYSEL